MDERTLTALKASIQHWRENAAALDPRDVKLASSDCALCFEFPGCKKCPVRMRTGCDSCRWTPYYKARDKRYAWMMGNATIEEWRKAAQAEIDFLISLLPEGEEA